MLCWEERFLHVFDYCCVIGRNHTQSPPHLVVPRAVCAILYIYIRIISPNLGRRCMNIFHWFNIQKQYFIKKVLLLRADDLLPRIRQEQEATKSSPGAGPYILDYFFLFP